MKAYLPIKKQPLPEYKSTGLFSYIRSSAKEHGYHLAVWYGIIRLKDHLLNRWARGSVWNGMRKRMQRWRGVTIGRNVHWGTDVIIDNPFPYFVIVEDGVSLAGSNYILTHTKPTKYFGSCCESYVAPVIIRKNAWIAVNVTILPGVEIGEGAIVSAGSVVSRDIPPMTIASGCPAKVISDISELLRDNYSEKEFAGIMESRKKKFKI